MKVAPDSISPQLWAQQGEDGIALYLLCGRRVGYKKPPLGSPAGVIGTDMVAPVVIDVSPPADFTFPANWVSQPTPIDVPFAGCRVLTKVRFGEQWVQMSLERQTETGGKELLIGMTEKCVRVALAEAYRGIKSAIIDLEKMSLKVVTNGKLLVNYEGGTPMRNIMTSFIWDKMDGSGIPVEERPELLKGMGWKGRALSEWAKRAGLW
jgi:hypothetical protein